jgi:hypothetical protein
MKKFSVIAIGILLSITMGATAFAMDSASLQNQTSEGLFDRTDPFDLALQSGLMYQLDLWRLYTNLSGYDQGDAYLIGTSGKLGPGSVAFFYETKDGEFQESVFTNFDYGYERGWHTDVNVPNYDGIDDLMYSGSLDIREDHETSEHNFYLGYGGDILDGVSLGLSYAPQMWESEGTPSGIFSGTLEDVLITDVLANAGTALTNLPLLVGWPFQRHMPMQGLPWLGKDLSVVFSSLNYTTNDYQSWTQFDLVAQTDSNLEQETTVHPFNLGSHMRLWDDWDILANVTYADIDRQDSLRSSLTATFNNSQFINQALDDYYRGNGSLGLTGSWDEDSDGNRWGLFVSPSWQMSDLIGFRLDLGYSKESGDNEGGGVLTVNGMTEEWVDDVSPATGTVDGAIDLSYDGDYETEDWLVEPRMTLTYDVGGRQMRFGLGVGYMRSQHDWDGLMRRDGYLVITYDDGDAPGPDNDDFTTWASFNGYENFDGETTTTAWRFPVATEFWLTERLRAGAGASYIRETVDYEEDGSGPWLDNESLYTAYGDGTRDVGPEQYRENTADTIFDPYDADSLTIGYRDDRKVTTDYTVYNLGLGYIFSEHLQFDLMWTGKGEDGGVDMTEVFASATLTF